MRRETQNISENMLRILLAYSDTQYELFSAQQRKSSSMINQIEIETFVIHYSNCFALTNYKEIRNKKLT